jgi:hypothetical protein
VESLTPSLLQDEVTALGTGGKAVQRDTHIQFASAMGTTVKILFKYPCTQKQTQTHHPVACHYIKQGGNDRNTTDYFHDF